MINQLVVAMVQNRGMSNQLAAVAAIYPGMKSLSVVAQNLGMNSL